MRTPILIGLFALAVALPVFAQSDDDATTRPDRPLMRPEPFGPGGGGFGPMARRLAERLELTPEQEVEYQKIFRKYEALAREQSDERTTMREFAEQYREARESGDDARADEIREKMTEFRGGQMQLFRDFTAEVQPLLTPEQVETLELFRERLQRLGPPGRGDELQNILRAARRLDLKDEQRDRIRQITLDAQAEQRELRRDPQANAELAKRVKTQIVELLDADQVAEFEKLLERAAPPPRRGDVRLRDRGEGRGAPPEGAGPRQREERGRR